MGNDFSNMSKNAKETNLYSETDTSFPFVVSEEASLSDETNREQTSAKNNPTSEDDSSDEFSLCSDVGDDVDYRTIGCGGRPLIGEISLQSLLLPTYCLPSLEVNIHRGYKRQFSLPSFSACTNPVQSNNNDNEDDDDDDDDDDKIFDTNFFLDAQTWQQKLERTFRKHRLRRKKLQQQLGSSHTDDDNNVSTDDPEEIAPSPESNLRQNRTYYIVTTAALPWMTGTAINPLLRAAYLNKYNRTFEGDGKVTLVIPWLEKTEDQIVLFGEDNLFNEKGEQEAYIRRWLSENAGLKEEAEEKHGGISILFYPARYHSTLSSIFAMGDICSLIPDEFADVCILEEPEHLNWYSAPQKQTWVSKFNHVIGIIHTNYKAYASSHYSGLVTSPMIGALSSLMVRAYCHKVIKLSSVLQTFCVEKEDVCNVHGIRQKFLEEGKRRRSQKENGECGIYFIGKLLWAKGFDKLLNLSSCYRSITGEYFPIDIYGSGPEEGEIRRAFRGRGGGGMYNSPTNSDSNKKRTEESSEKKPRLEIPKSRHELRRHPIPANFLGRVDHANLKQKYKIFVNTSVTEVLATTTAEAIAMGKFVIIPRHPSNTFFLQFPNCLSYKNKYEFVANMIYAMQEDPEPLTDESMYKLTWEAATQRLIRASVITKKEAKKRKEDQEGESNQSWEEWIAKVHYEIGKGVKGDVIRKVLGAGPVSCQSQYEKELSEEKRDVITAY